MTTTVQTRSLDVQTLKTRLETDDAPRILDVRTPGEFESAHIPGAYNVPLDTLREHRTELQRHLGEDVVLVCQSGTRAEQAERALAEIGLPGLRVLQGGMAAWQSADAPVNQGKQTWELERQVRLVAGGVVLSSILGSTALPRLKWLAGGIGAGLTFAALSNTCAMGMALAKMPWNNRGASHDIDDVLRALAENN